MGIYKQAEYTLYIISIINLIGWSTVYFLSSLYSIIAWLSLIIISMITITYIGEELIKNKIWAFWLKILLAGITVTSVEYFSIYELGSGLLHWILIICIGYATIGFLGTTDSNMPESVSLIFFAASLIGSSGLICIIGYQVLLQEIHQLFVLVLLSIIPSLISAYKYRIDRLP